MKLRNVAFVAAALALLLLPGCGQSGPVTPATVDRPVTGDAPPPGEEPVLAEEGP